MKKILGLDLGTNSIGWSLIEQDFNNKEGKILGMGSRIIPMSQDVLGKFDSGQSHSQTAERTNYRGVRRLYQRDNLRRERLHRVLNVMGFLPRHYANGIDFAKHLGQFKEGEEPKINYVRDDSNRHRFLFMDSFNEMLVDFINSDTTLKVPHDWTIYFLRKKALVEKITKEELAWILLNFNQKRGYYQLRGEEENQDINKKEEYQALKVNDVEETDERNANGTWYNVILEKGFVYRRQSKESLKSWRGKTKEFIITTQLEGDGSPKTDKEGNVKRSFRSVDSEKDWIAIKSKTENDIEHSGKTVGQYIYESLRRNPKQKIRGKLIRTIERKYYREELHKILETQRKFHPELNDRKLYQACVAELYPRNEAHRDNIKDKLFTYLFVHDIIFYQRPLKSKKSTIASCAYEKRCYKKLIEEKDEHGNLVKKKVTVSEGLNAIPKSNPLFQEFRLWQFLSNLRIYRKNVKQDEDVTESFFQTEDDWVELFDFLNSRKDIDQKQIIDFFIKKELVTRGEKDKYRWNYVEDKKYPCNETRAEFKSRLNKVEGSTKVNYFSVEIEKHLWHIVYSVTDKKEFETALSGFAEKYGYDVPSFVCSFKNIPPYKSEYGSYSEKAIKKLLPLMQKGKYWDKNKIDNKTIQRIERIIDGEYDESINERVREKFTEFRDVVDFQGFPLWLACYVVYNRHSESSDNIKWVEPEDIDHYLSEFRQHSLRNPIVEQVLTETLRTVRDIWEYYGNGVKDYFSEIHVELGRKMKNPAKIRQKIAARNVENENTNERIRKLLYELMNDSEVRDDVRPYSPNHQEILKIYEDGLISNPNVNYSEVSEDEIIKIRKNVSPSASDIKRYKLWMKQGYASPYTGKIIGLGELFSTRYQIEHIIPQARYFDDSMSNKVICESEVNQLKGSRTAYEFLKAERGRVVELSGGETVKLFTLEAYENHCSRYFNNNREKLKKLMTEEIPEGFIERQMNDSRYISKLVKSLLNNIVRDEYDKDSISYKVVPVTGAITSKLKQDWGLNDKWNEIVAPRFKRLNEIHKTTDFGYFDKRINAFRCEVPDDLKRNFSKKRIDHRHHAMDALVVACTTREHINYLNSLNSESENYSLRNRLLQKNEHGHFTKTMLMPWNGFPKEAYDCLNAIVVSFKQNNRVINKTNNKTWQWVSENGALKKKLVKQIKGENWAIRKPMHKETVSGAVNVRLVKEVSFSNGIKDWENLLDKKLKKIIKALHTLGHDSKGVAQYFKKEPYILDGAIVTKVKVYSFTKNATATRTELTDKFTAKQLASVTDHGIQSILKNHLKNYTDDNGKERFDLAFSPEGLDEMNKNIVELNRGKAHQPIYKVRVYEEGSKFCVGEKGAKRSKFVEAAKGSNLFFAIYWNEDKQKREYETIPLDKVIAHQKMDANLPKEERTPVPINRSKGRLLFVLSPNDLVYVPTVLELETYGNIYQDIANNISCDRIYKIVSCTGNRLYAVPVNVSISIWNKNEYSSLNKLEFDLEGKSIKEFCFKLLVNRVGNITRA